MSSKRDYQVHRVRFVDFKSKTINAVAFNNDGENSKLAVAKGDGSIEIRSPASNWLIEYVIPGNDKRSVEHLAWCDGRLFSGSVTGHIIEWDLQRLQPKYHQDSYGGPVWCLKFNYAKKILATGCEDGGIHMFDVYKDSIMYRGCLNKQQSRILCLAWTHDDEFIFTGGFDCSLLKCDVNTGHIVQRMTTDNPRDANTMVWSLEVLRDMTVVIGDSLGQTQFWDGKMCTLLQSFKSHQADVLAVAVDDAGQNVFSTGIDSAIQNFSLVDPAGRVWAMAKHTRPMQHDVRTLCMCGPYNRLVAGGIDPRLMMFRLDEEFGEKNYFRFSCLPRSDSCQLAKEANLLCFRDTQALHIWKLGSSLDSHPKPTKLFEIKSGKSPDHLVCSAISHDGRYAAYANINKGQAFELVNESAVKKCAIPVPPCTQMCFTRKSNELVALGHQSILTVINIAEGTTTSTSLNMPKEFTPTMPYKLMRVSPCDKFVCVVDSSSNVLVFNLSDGTYVSSMPRFPEVVVDCTFVPLSSERLRITTANKHIYEYNMDTEKLDDWCLRLNSTGVVTCQLENRQNTNYGSTSIAINPHYPEEIFLQNQFVFGKIVYGCPLPEPKGDNGMVTTEQSKMLFRVNAKSGSTLVFLDFNDNGEIVVVEEQVEKVLTALPAPLKIKQFGN